MLANLRPRGVGETLDAAVALYKARFPALVARVAIVVIPFECLNGLIALSTSPSKALGSTNTNGVFDAGATVWTPLAGNFASTIVTTLSTAIATAMVVQIVADAYLGPGNAKPDRSNIALRRFGAVLGLSAVTALLVTAGTTLCVIPGIWLQVAWIVAMPALLLEHKRVGAALSRSFQLTKGNWWRCFGVYVVGQLLASFVSLVLVGIVAFSIHSVAHGGAAVAIERTISGMVAGVLTVPFVAAAVIVMYFDLRIRSEGFDIQMAVRDLDLRHGAAPVQAR